MSEATDSYISGGANNDLLGGAAGKDTIDGGLGDDTIGAQAASLFSSGSLGGLSQAYGAIVTATEEFVAETVAGMNYLKGICKDLGIPVD